MAVLALVVSLAMAGVLLWAGLEKARNVGPSVSTLMSLGVPRRQARLATHLLSLIEIGAGFGLVFQPHLVWTQLGIVILGLLFALAGIIALQRDHPIRCNCFGVGVNGQLGRTQVLTLWAWLSGAAVFYHGFDQPVSLSAGAIRVATLGLVMATMRAVAVWGARREARDDRQSAMEMYLWRF